MPHSSPECIALPLISKRHPESDVPSRNCLCEKEAQSSGNQALVVPRPIDEKKLIILIDMDNTLNDWDRQFRRLCAFYYPTMPMIPPAERVHYHMELNYSSPKFEQWQHVPAKLTELQGFWSEMPVAAGAYDAIMEMVFFNFELFFVTKPDGRFLGRSCQEKANWLEKNFGSAFKQRMIPCCDKTLVRGHILIDDNPESCSGLAEKPSWTLCLYCQPYNRHLKGHQSSAFRLHSWSSWKRDLSKCIELRTCSAEHFAI